MIKILIVEDQPESRYMLEQLLASRGHRVMSAENGEEALRLAGQEPPEVIISDIMMPVMNGFKLCCRVKKDPALRHIPFIFYTATFTDESDRKLAMSLGASRFLVKPTEGEIFLQILEDVLKNHRNGILSVPEGPLEKHSDLIEMYENSITRKLAETVEKLQEERRVLIQSERRLKEAQELAHIGHWELDLKTDALEWSDEIYRILGVKPRAFDPSYRKLMTMEVIHPDDRVEVIKSHKESLTKKTPCDIEYRLLLKDGTLKYVNEKFQTLYDDEGTPTCSMGTVQDITQRKEAEADLREAESMYRVHFENVSDVIYSIDREFKLINISPSVERLLGYRAEELIGRPFQELNLLASEYVEQAASDTMRVLGGERLTSAVYQFIGRDGTKKWGEVSASPLIRDGQIVALVSVARDITARKEAEEALRESEEKYRSILESMEEGYYEVDLAGNFTFFNDAMCRIRGYTRDEMMGMNNRQYMDPETAKKVYKSFNEVYRTQKSIKGYEWEIMRRDGTEGNVEVSVSLIKGLEGKPVGFRGIARDISERKQAEKEKTRLEAQLIQAQKMESVGRLAGGVAHDFNNKLTVILGYAQMAMNDLDKADPMYGNLQQVMNAGKQSVDIVRQLLAFARKQIIAPELLDLNETMEGMLKMLRRLIGEDIHLAWEPATDLWPVKMDPSQIDQILANLCVNARDAIQGAGKVTIETRNTILNEAYCAEHAGAVPGDYVMLAVSDEGCGMERQTLENIFEPFFTTKEAGKGTGLGLATVYGIVKQNNGFIDVESEPGRGSAFRIYLPRHGEEVEEKAEAVEAEIPQGRGETILIVEDDAPVLQLAQRILENLGYAVLTSASPPAAITTAREYQGEIHLLMTDVVLPEMSGKELAGEMIKIRPNIQILFMSGYTANVIAHHGVLDEGVQFIGKPFSPDSLARKVREALGSEK